MTEKNRVGMGFEMKIKGADDQGPGSNLPRDNQPFCIAVLADLSGQAEKTGKSFAEHKFIAIDRDNFDEILEKTAPSLSLSMSTGSAEHVLIGFKELDDFHPDALYDKLEIFSRLRSIRRRLQNNATFDEAASEIMGWLVEPEEHSGVDEKEDVEKKSATSNEPPEELLNSVLSATQQPPTELESVLQTGGIDRLVKEIIAPYVEPAANPQQPDMIDAVDEAIAGHMRQILHHPEFQRLEATWRSIYFLTRRLETDRHLKIYLLDVSKDELAADLGGEVSISALRKHFCEPALNDINWGLILGDYIFEDRIEDVLLLSQLGEIAHCAGAPFLAGARETIAGCDSFARSADPEDWQYSLKPGFEQAWTMLQESDVAEYIGLALPRFLLRLPYGKKTRPIESFSFEELEGEIEGWHEAHLWGNAAFIKAEQLARAYSDGGWESMPGEYIRSENLPAYYYDDEDGETVMMPCAEIYLTEKGGKQLSSQGLITLWSVKNQDAISSSGFQSLSSSQVQLKGRWVKH
jgi:type VI secretion system protein ImpC